MSDELENPSLLRRAYRAAKREGYILRKSRRAISPQNHGGLMLVDPATGAPLVGWDYDATPAEVLDYLGVIELPSLDAEVKEVHEPNASGSVDHEKSG